MNCELLNEPKSEQKINMVNRVLIIVITFLLASALIAGYFYLREQDEIVGESALYAVPIDAGVVVESHNITALFDALLNDNALWQELTNIASVQKVNHRMALLDSLIGAEVALEKLLDESSGIVSLHNRGKNSLEFLFLLHLRSTTNQQVAAQYLNDELAGQATITKKRYSNALIYKVDFNDSSKQDFWFAFYQNVYVMSYYPLLVEEAIRQMNSLTSFKNDEAFLKIEETAGKNAKANVYINFSTLANLLTIFTGELYQSNTYAFISLSDWAELDLNISSEEVLLNGYASVDAAGDYMKVFMNQQPHDFEVANVLPEKTATFLAVGFDNYPALMLDYRNYLESNGKMNNYREHLDQINADLGLEIEPLFEQFVDNELVIAFVEENPGTYEVYFLVEALYDDKAESQLAKILKNYSINERKDPSKLMVEYLSDNETYTIYNMPVLNLIRKLYGDLFSAAIPNYYTLVEDYVVFGKSRQALASFIDYYTSEQTLDNQHKYSRVIASLSDESSLLFYSDIGRSVQLYQQYAAPSLQHDFANNTTILKSFQAVCAQFYPNQGMMYNNVLLRYNPDLQNSPHTAWECALNAPAQTKPFLVTNHYTQEKEMVVQDTQNTLYLISNKGKVLWKKTLSEAINGSVFQIDFYENGKLQLLFATKNFLHLLDRNGNYVANYPVALPAAATSPLAVFDYAQNRDYRFFIACENKQVYLFDKSGTLKEGWDFAGTELPVTSEVQFFRNLNKDYIVLNDKANTYFLSRRGEERLVVPRTDFNASPRNKFYMQNATRNHPARLVSTDTEGTLTFITFDGKTEQHSLQTYPAQHHFACHDIDGDNLQEYIFVSETELQVFNSDFSQRFDYSFPQPVSEAPLFYPFSETDVKIGIVSGSDQQLYLFNNNGTLYPKFPVKGNTPFSIAFFKQLNAKFNLLTGSGNGFIYNYEVH